MKRQNPDNIITLIVNPISGTKKKEGIVNLAMESFRRAGLEPDLRYTERAGHATELAADAVKEGIKRIVAIGGDGTINEVASALIDTDATLGIIPSGSGNGLARHLGIPMNAAGAIKIIAEGNSEPLDYCTVNGRKFFCTFGLGYDAAVAESFAKKKKRGLVNYVKSAIGEYFSFKPDRYSITADSEILEGDFYIVSACNASQYGNDAYIAPKADSKDGKLDLVVVLPGNHLSRSAMSVKLFLKKIDEGRHIRYRQVKEAVIKNHSRSGFPAHLDGEPFRIEGDIHLQCHERRLNVFAPVKP